MRLNCISSNIEMEMAFSIQKKLPKIIINSINTHILQWNRANCKNKIHKQLQEFDGNEREVSILGISRTHTFIK